MTTKNKIIKFIADLIGFWIAWLFWYIALVMVCALFGWNPLEETMYVMSFVMYLIYRVDDLSNRLEG